jgi:diacylglycerol kinase family enzyme
VTVLLNPAAGGIRLRGPVLSERPDKARVEGPDGEIAKLFAAAGCQAEVHVLQQGRDPADAARAASAAGSIVVAAGGDGTVSRVAAGVVEADGTLGVLPLGTLNHFAKDLQIPLELDAAVRTVAAGRVGRVDVGQVNHRLFVNNSSIGLYPSIVHVRDQLRRHGHWKWTAMVIATARVLHRYRGVRVRIEEGGRERLWRTPFVFVGNNEYTVDGINLGGRVSLDRGRLFVYLAPRVRTRHLPVLFLKALAGRAGRSGDFEIVSSAELLVDTHRPHRRVRVALDGEVMKMVTPLHYRTRPGALKVMLPRA